MNQDKPIKPSFTLLFTLAVMGLLGLIMYFFPVDGIPIGKTSLQLPEFADFFNTDSSKSDSLEQLEKDLQVLFDSTERKQKIDSTLLQRKLDSLKKVRQDIQVPESAKPDLQRLFAALDNARNKKVRIMHYGDSQIEGDRITSYLRNELQSKFGGSGPGMFDVIQVAPKGSVNITYSENWLRFSGFGRKDSTVRHNRYGPLMAFSRFAPIPDSSRALDTTQIRGQITLKKPTASYAKNRTYTNLGVLLSNPYRPVKYTVVSDGSVLFETTLPVSTSLQVVQTPLSATPEELILQFSGLDSPDIYGISLESNTGVIVDNIPLRGSSGTIFAKQDLQLLGEAYRNLSPDLIILEFGGNVIPYVEDEEECREYGNWFKAQINLLKRLNPKSTFLLIGPADTSIKDKTEYVTHPFLEPVRDALKQTAQETGCLFWDMYEVMGGRNTMPVWVDSDPPLAAPDYIHFSRQGAQKMAEDFVQKFFKLYDDYKNPSTLPSASIAQSKDSTVPHVP